MNIELWQAIVGLLGSILASSTIAGFIALRWAKRTNEAETKKLEEEAKQAQKQTDSIELENAQKLIQMYQEGMEKLNDLYHKYREESDAQYKELEKAFEDYKKATREQIHKLEDQVRELKNQLNTNCAQCPYSAECKKRIALGIPHTYNPEKKTRRTKKSSEETKLL